LALGYWVPHDLTESNAHCVPAPGSMLISIVADAVTTKPLGGQKNKNTAVLAMLRKVATNCHSKEFHHSTDVEIPTDTTDFAKVLAKFDSQTPGGDEDDRDDGWDW
jgi:hypothetical protein